LRNKIAEIEDAPHPTILALNGLAYLMLRLSTLLLSFMTHTATSALIWGASHNPVVASKER
jgi:hypothetical protein